ncbi:MAG: hypothetical protein IPJ85_10920 [Flavobacteriales bacterium]|nr:hypothetical protein [Flavobacteriales bacterium]
MPPRAHTLDGEYVVLANLGGVQDHNRFRPFLMKTDLNGDTLWTRTVGKPGYTYITQDLLPYSDGGFLLSGIIYGNMPNGTSGLMYIYKADSLGHFPCWEHAHPMEQFELFPVDSSFTLTAVDVPTTVTPVYVQDSILDPSLFTTFDGCTFTTGLPDLMSRSRTKPRIRPNPNTGRFTLEVADPLIAESYYSVYDALGKLLYQRPLPTAPRWRSISRASGLAPTCVGLTDPEELLRTGGGGVTNTIGRWCREHLLPGRLACRALRIGLPLVYTMPSGERMQLLLELNHPPPAIAHSPLPFPHAKPACVLEPAPLRPPTTTFAP